MGVRGGGMAAGRLRRRRPRAPEVVAGRRVAWSPPLGVLPYLETGGALRGEAGVELRHCQGAAFFTALASPPRLVKSLASPLLEDDTLACSAKSEIVLHSAWQESRTCALHGLWAPASPVLQARLAQGGTLDRVARWSGRAGSSPALPRSPRLLAHPPSSFASWCATPGRWAARPYSWSPLDAPPSSCVCPASPRSFRSESAEAGIRHR